jgi:hypothetical protein
VGTSGSHNPSSTLRSWKKAEFSDSYHIEVFPTWKVCGLETYKLWSCLELQLQYRLLPTPYTYRLAVCQQVPTEMDRKKKTPTHSSSLFNELESNSPLFFFPFFLSNTFVHFSNQRCVYNKVLQWFDDLNLFFFYNHLLLLLFKNEHCLSA